jgi:Protein of unknown function (DUF4239)
MIILTKTPLWVLGILAALLTLISMSGPFLVRRRISLERLSTNNEVAGFKFATIGVIYAVLLGFAVITVWGKWAEAETNVGIEAGAAVTVFRLANGIDDETTSAVRARMADYLRAVIAADWPAMQLGTSSPEVTRALTRVYQALLQYQPKDARGSAVMTELLRQLDLLGQARRARIVMAAGVVPSIVWLVLFGGAVITIAFTFLFATKNLGAQVVMTGGLALLIFSTLLVIIAIDHPFAGSIRVESTPLAVVLADFGGAKP